MVRSHTTLRRDRLSARKSSCEKSQRLCSCRRDVPIFPRYVATVGPWSQQIADACVNFGVGAPPRDFPKLEIFVA
ncbi:MAG: hypothetical protein DWH97_00105 [Planctomycetota bacterium]|nr:MAG: hypothetical protein DWH97_00105 [Planctomycetota bacterium]RLS95890.1 MAG: hypothetical protein DWI12_03655 [Planctomycetota bacterium]